MTAFPKIVCGLDLGGGRLIFEGVVVSVPRIVNISMSVIFLHNSSKPGAIFS